MKQFTQNKFLVLLVAILLIANLGLMLYFFAFRERQSSTRQQSRGGSDFMEKQLGFNADQAARFHELRDQHKEAVKPLIDQMKRLKDSLYTLLRDPQANDSVVADLTKRIAEEQEKWELMIFHHFQKLRAICDSNQLPKFDSLVHHMINGPWMRKRKPADR